MIAVTVILEPPPRDWECSHCDVTARTAHDVANRYHMCRGLAGLQAPLTPKGSGARLVAVEREDYVHGEMVQTDGYGRPIMALRVERPDGSNDTVVYSPTARGHGQGVIQDGVDG